MHACTPAGLQPLKTRLQRKYFLVNIVKFLRAAVFIEQVWWLLLWIKFELLFPQNQTLQTTDWQKCLYYLKVTVSHWMTANIFGLYISVYSMKNLIVVCETINIVLGLEYLHLLWNLNKMRDNAFEFKINLDYQKPLTALMESMLN